MKKVIVMIVSLLMVIGAVIAESQPYIEENVIIESENYDISATICTPVDTGFDAAIVMLHGAGSDRNGIGDSYELLAHELSEKYNIASIRIDFPGSGDSTIDYSYYNYFSAVADVKAASIFVKEKKAQVNKIGVLGWDQGATIAMLSCAWEPDFFNALVTWAGIPDLIAMGVVDREICEKGKINGQFKYTTTFGKEIIYGGDWCDDVLNIDVLDEFAQGNELPVLAIAGTDDTIVTPEWNKKIVEASNQKNSREYYIEGATHDFGILSGDQTTLQELIQATGEFFTEVLYDSFE